MDNESQFQQAESSEYETESEYESVETDEECLLQTLPATSDSVVHTQDVSFDPRLEVSDHEDDNELSKHGYGSCDTDEEDEEQDSEVNERLVSKDSWCKCGNCQVLNSEIECYCCRESSHMSNLILDKEDIGCVINCELFTTGICNKKVLQMCSFGMLQKTIPLDKDGNILAKGLRYAAYRNFLNICELRYIGKKRRYVLPACAIIKIRSLYPSLDGKYKSFQMSEIVSRI